MWEALILFFLQVTRPGLGENAYECGDHGRFEYCIDEIPGCVIGCHCHPGFYFDTDTKICEPNSRLLDHQRRANEVKQARVQIIDVTPTAIYKSEQTSSTNVIDGHVDEIAKDANDLGDWLYNQFFKTIENQVINNTNDKDILTRRSGPQKSIQKPKVSKNWRKRGKSSKQKRKKGQLRRKLLRITENDSLFDLSSKSSSDSSESSSSSELSSMEYEVDESNHHKHDDDEHGHKQIVMINKKPKQPLPSFIFLPNLDTPFYPPIGLPPPPIVPMYPMVPVPPVPLCPISGCDNEDKNQAATTSTELTTTTPTTTVAGPSATFAGASTTDIKSTTTITSVQSNLPETTAVTALTIDANATTDVPNTDTKTLRKKYRKKNKMAARLLNNDGRVTEGSNSLKNINRQKLLQRLKEKINNPSANLFMPFGTKNKKILGNKFVNQKTNAEIPGVDEYPGEIPGVDDNEINLEPGQKDGTFPNNVDFKYISELIHPVDPNNNSINLPPIEYNPSDSIEMYQSPNIPRNQFDDFSVPFDGRRKSRPKYHKPDESYYANLGRQIAKMIRSMNTKENAEFADTSPKIINEPYLNHSPTTFWERYVRSPLAYLNTKKKNYEYLKRSNELLFDIENRVEIIASTAPALSLQEIENIVKVMQAAKKEIESKTIPDVRNSRTSSKNLNIDLWPQKSRKSRNKYKSSATPYLNKVKHEKNVNSFTTVDSKSILHNSLPAIHMHSIQKLEAWNKRNFRLINQTHNIPSSTKPSIKNDFLGIALSNYNLEKPNKIQISARPFSQNSLTKTFLNHERINSNFLRQRKYFQDTYNNNYYETNNPELPHLPSVVSIAVHPTYFPEINQFDYAL